MLTGPNEEEIREKKPGKHSVTNHILNITCSDIFLPLTKLEVDETIFKSINFEFYFRYGKRVLDSVPENDASPAF